MEFGNPAKSQSGKCQPTALLCLNKGSFQHDAEGAWGPDWGILGINVRAVVADSDSYPYYWTIPSPN